MASSRSPSLARSLLRTARPKLWTRNAIVFAAPAAAGVLTHGHAFWRCCAAAVAFCFLASGTYFFNDAADADADRVHPTKRNRPIAAGLISLPQAVASAVVLCGAALAIGFVVSWRLGLVLAIYLAVQVAYSVWLKHEAVLDLGAVASGFVLRALAGAVAVPVRVSQWFLIVACFGSLLMVTGKRLAEHMSLGEERGLHRATLEQYSTSFLRTVLATATAGAMVGYCIWAFDLQTAALHNHDPIWFQTSIIPMMLALLRYSFLVDSGRGGSPEELLLADRVMQVLAVVWVALFAIGVYVG